ncbi:MAG: hypothetical protein F4Y42_10030, partial [Caldilineaceae bacterium SB0664_bin_27]|nr:hypothetical protein [Caldilineaceae bacterium SB0664_bin_27]
MGVLAGPVAGQLEAAALDDLGAGGPEQRAELLERGPPLVAAAGPALVERHREQGEDEQPFVQACAAAGLQAAEAGGVGQQEGGDGDVVLVLELGEEGQLGLGAFDAAEGGVAVVEGEGELGGHGRG